MIYIIGSLANREIPKVGGLLRNSGFQVFDNWYSAGEFADRAWQEYEQAKGNTFAQALRGPSALNVFQFDKTYLDICTAAVLVGPAGKSGHLELGYVIGQGKPGFMLLPGEPSKFDVMAAFCAGVHTDINELIADLKDRRIA